MYRLAPTIETCGQSLFGDSGTDGACSGFGGAGENVGVVAAAGTIRVPEDAFAGDVPLVAVKRGEFVGSLHRGTAVVVDAEGAELLSLGDARQPVFLRSGAKPFQVLPAVMSGAVERFGIEDSELAVLCASHNAEPYHTAAVLSVLAKIGLEERFLHCGAHPPLHAPTAAARLRHGIEPSPVCNNCSGAHAGMLLACRGLGLSTDTYGDADHPLQIETRQILATFAGLEPEEIDLAVDNCAVPTFRLPLTNAGLAFGRLASGFGLPAEYAAAAARVSRAMTAYPEMVGGEQRFDTDLMRAAGQLLVSKGGAEGFQGVGMVDGGIGLAIKISDGNARASEPTTLALLQSFDVLDEGALTKLESYAHPILYNLRGAEVGSLETVFTLASPH